MWGSLNGYRGAAILKLKIPRKIEDGNHYSAQHRRNPGGSNFPKKIEALGTYESFDEKIDAMLVQEQRDIAENPEDFPFDEWPED